MPSQSMRHTKSGIEIRAKTNALASYVLTDMRGPKLTTKSNYYEKVDYRNDRNGRTDSVHNCLHKCNGGGM